ncbi:MAG: phosphosulfolactate synthase [Chloroflexota bacterium]
MITFRLLIHQLKIGGKPIENYSFESNFSLNIMIQETAFSKIELPSRTKKPRSIGVTMMIDWGIPLNHQLDVLEISSDYIDMAKIAGTIAGLIPKRKLKEKLSAYHSFDISTSQGGLYFEYAYLKNQVEPFFEEIKSLGFSAIEVSDNLLSWNLDEKRRTIQLAINNFGLKVLGEVGRKDETLSNDFIIQDIAACLDAGAAAVFIEAYELFPDGEARHDLIAQIFKRFPKEKIIFELPVIVLPDITRNFKHKISTWMISEFGADVNLANVESDEILMTEMLRTRTGDNLIVE